MYSSVICDNCLDKEAELQNLNISSEENIQACLKSTQIENENVLEPLFK